jgi:signal transduction histidine kinase
MSMTNVTLLLIEDDLNYAQLIEQYLVKCRWRGEIQEIPELIQTSQLSEETESRYGKADLILLDLDLVDSTGLETLRSVQSNAETTPIVVLTESSDKDMGIKAVENGAQDFLIKNEITAPLLQRIVQYSVERARKQRALRSRNRKLAILDQIVHNNIQDDLSILLGRGETLEDYVDPGGEEYLTEMLDAAGHMTQLTRTVGEVLKILDAQQEAELRSVDLRHVLHTEIERARSTHDTAQFTVDDESSDELIIKANKMLSLVFRSLLNNAVKHNDKEQPEVTVELEVAADRVKIAVADNGPGIPDSGKHAVFNQKQIGLKIPESGVGLYLVNTIVDMFGGEIWVDDKHPEGSVFQVELPRI